MLLGRFPLAAISLLGVIALKSFLLSQPLRGQDVAAGSTESREQARADLAQLTPPDYAEEQELRRVPPTRMRVYSGVDVVSMYISRGLVYSSKVSGQPWLEAVVPLEGLSPYWKPLDRVSWLVGNWNSFQEGDPGLGQARTGRLAIQDNWYETDLYTGLRFKPIDNLQTSLRFNWYHSPSASFGNIEELDFRISYNDASVWQRVLDWPGFNLTPSLRVAKELGDQGGPEQWYFQPTLTPSFSIKGLPMQPRFKLPIAFGFGADGQYVEIGGGKERHFGFVQVGLGLELPLELLPKSAGSLNLSMGVDAVMLPDKDLSFRGNQIETVAKAGIAHSF